VKNLELTIGITSLSLVLVEHLLKSLNTERTERQQTGECQRRKKGREKAGEEEARP
jgi:hypothetical protein